MYEVTLKAAIPSEWGIRRLLEAIPHGGELRGLEVTGSEEPMKPVKEEKQEKSAA